jgi:hypothetical protein
MQTQWIANLKNFRELSAYHSLIIIGVQGTI